MLEHVKYTGEIYDKRHSDDTHTVLAKFYNSNTKQNFYMDERDLHDYIDANEGDDKEFYIDIMRELQSYKQEHGIELSYKPVDEWELIDYSRFEPD